jgi:hypothetical protein
MVFSPQTRRHAGRNARLELSQQLELAVDSRRHSQSDNDDDGNRGVRINYVLEFGNYGYKDELTGAAWKVARENLEKEIPQQHWHLNDPGVVPNVLLTGAGSPTGICVYEGTLLPKVFHNQPIHCDAGPNVCRASSPERDGRGVPGGDGQRAVRRPATTGIGRATSASRTTTRCSLPIGTIRASAATTRDAERPHLPRRPPCEVCRPLTATAAGCLQALENPNLEAATGRSLRSWQWATRPTIRSKSWPRKPITRG